MTRHPVHTSGLSTVHASIATSATVVLLMLSAFAERRTFDIADVRRTSVEIERMTERAVRSIATHLAEAEPTSIVAGGHGADGDPWISFRRWDAGDERRSDEPSWAELQWQADPLDPRDDVDNDGDGLVDEGSVVLTDSDDAHIVIARNVVAPADAPHERGLVLRRGGGLLRISLTLGVRGADRRVLTRTAVTSIPLPEIGVHVSAK